MSDYTWHIPDPVTQPEFYDDVPTKRAIAWVIDSVLILVVSLLILPFTAFTGIFFFPALLFVVGLVYRIATISRGSATWGMRVLSIEFRTRDGDKFDPTMAAMHTVAFSFSFVFFPLHVLSIILILTSQRRQSLVDHVLGTVVINQRAGS